MTSQGRLAILLIIAASLPYPSPPAAKLRGLRVVDVVYNLKCSMSYFALQSCLSRGPVNNESRNKPRRLVRTNSEIDHALSDSDFDYDLCSLFLFR